ncbi:hypothetical protein NLJ89_g3663 [Agrocybe chaxingu]|uniref:Uncharacterized protein n=1 Tax=Agrocybe chaxingu TaxID=84603 RepID=A0A9W8MX67_9AGAR|nr:hypothetical protein NLJ89_g3663 [Agrocybe chaxingu]
MPTTIMIALADIVRPPTSSNVPNSPGPALLTQKNTLTPIARAAIRFIARWAPNLSATEIAQAFDSNASAIHKAVNCKYDRNRDDPQEDEMLIPGDLRERLIFFLRVYHSSMDDEKSQPRSASGVLTRSRSRRRSRSARRIIESDEEVSSLEEEDDDEAEWEAEPAAPLTSRTVRQPSPTGSTKQKRAHTVVSETPPCLKRKANTNPPKTSAAKRTRSVTVAPAPVPIPNTDEGPENLKKLKAFFSEAGDYQPTQYLSDLAKAGLGPEELSTLKGRKVSSVSRRLGRMLPTELSSPIKLNVLAHTIHNAKDAAWEKLHVNEEDE